MTVERAQELTVLARNCYKHGELDRVRRVILKMTSAPYPFPSRGGGAMPVVQIENFATWVTSERCFDCTTDEVLDLFQRDADGLRQVRAALKLPVGSNIVTTHASPVRGNRKDYALERLHRDHPELYDRVVSGELSAHRAAIQAGIRKEPTPLERALRAYRKLSPAERDQFEQQKDEPQ